MKPNDANAVMEPVKEAFLKGDPAAMAIIYNRFYRVMMSRALDKGVGPQDAADVAMNAMMYVQGRETVPDNLAAVLLRATDWHAQKFLRDGGYELTNMTDDSMSEDDWRVSDDEELAHLQDRVHPLAPDHMQASTEETPETIAEGNDAIRITERLIRQRLSGEHWDVFYRNTAKEETFEYIAQTLGLSVRTAKGRIAEVRELLAQEFARN